jgi:D-glycero-D-manno-heptose 1,7-bisphosphate phosphatase
LRPGLLLDRDGVINEECHYLHDPKDLVMIPGADKAIAEINQCNIPVAVVSNQAGIGRGLYGVEAYNAVNRAIADHLAQGAAHIDAWYFCPHTSQDACLCRKPLPGMLIEAAKDLNFDLRDAVFVGDKESDLAAARAAGCRAVLVRTGYGQQVERDLLAHGKGGLFDCCCDSLLAALPFLKATLSRSFPPPPPDFT